MEVSIAELHPSPLNPRKVFPNLDELETSIRSFGILEPLITRPAKDGKGYEIVGGERRWRAASKVGLAKVPVVVRELNDEQVLEIMVVENCQRVDLSLVEQADAFRELQEKFKLTVDQIAERTGKTKATVYARLKLATLGSEGRQALASDVIDASTALTIARLPTSVQPRAIEVATVPPGHPPRSHRETVDRIERACYRALRVAPWPVAGDDTLVAGVPACSACPKNTRNFPKGERAAGSADVCTDLTCWDRKLDVVFKNRLIAAEKTGGGTVPPKEARKLFDDWGRLSYESPYAEVKNAPPKLTKSLPIFVAKTPGGELVDLFKRPEEKPAAAVDWDKRQRERNAKEKEKQQKRVDELEVLVAGIRNSPALPEWFWKALFEAHQWHVPDALRRKLKVSGDEARVAAVLAFIADQGRHAKQLPDEAAKTWARANAPAPVVIKAPQAAASKRAPVKAAAKKAAPAKKKTAPAKKAARRASR